MTFKPLGIGLVVVMFSTGAVSAASLGVPVGVVSMAILVAVSMLSAVFFTGEIFDRLIQNHPTASVIGWVFGLNASLGATAFFGVPAEAVMMAQAGLMYSFPAFVVLTLFRSGFDTSPQPADKTSVAKSTSTR